MMQIHRPVVDCIPSTTAPDNPPCRSVPRRCTIRNWRSARWPAKAAGAATAAVPSSLSSTTSTSIG